MTPDQEQPVEQGQAALRAALTQASFALRTIAPDDADAKMTVRMIDAALAATTQATQTAQPAADERDAARYRWLKQNAATGSLRFGSWWIGADDLAEELDEAIDAALSQDQPKERE